MMGREIDHAASEVLRMLLKLLLLLSMVRIQDAPLSKAALSFAALVAGASPGHFSNF
jgi:hypothetical protein